MDDKNILYFEYGKLVVKLLLSKRTANASLFSVGIGTVNCYRHSCWQCIGVYCCINSCWQRIGFYWCIYNCWKSVGCVLLYMVNAKSNHCQFSEHPSASSRVRLNTYKKKYWNKKLCQKWIHNSIVWRKISKYRWKYI